MDMGHKRYPCYSLKQNIGPQLQKGAKKLYQNVKPPTTKSPFWNQLFDASLYAQDMAKN